MRRSQVRLLFPAPVVEKPRPLVGAFCLGVRPGWGLAPAPQGYQINLIHIRAGACYQEGGCEGEFVPAPTSALSSLVKHQGRGAAVPGIEVQIANGRRILQSLRGSRSRGHT